MGAAALRLVVHEAITNLCANPRSIFAVREERPAAGSLALPTYSDGLKLAC